jgi:hypothetical protein
MVALHKYQEAKECALTAKEKFPNSKHVLISLIEVFRVLNDRQTSLGYSEELKTKFPDDPAGYKSILNDLLILGLEDDAIAFLESCKNIFSQEIIEKHFSKYNRFFGEKNLALKGEQSLERTWQVISSELKSHITNPFWNQISSYSDYVLVGNDSGLSLNTSDFKKLSLLDRPLYVHLNGGNAKFIQMRNETCEPGFKDLIFGEGRFVANADGMLRIPILNLSKSPDCLLYGADSNFWTDLIQLENIEINVKSLNEFKFSHFCRENYLHSTFSNNGTLSRRIPTTGWLAISIFGSILNLKGKEMRSGKASKLWVSGYSMSLPYMFEDVSTDQHDHVMERFVQDSLIEKGILNCIGSRNS